MQRQTLRPRPTRGRPPGRLRLGGSLSAAATWRPIAARGLRYARHCAERTRRLAARGCCQTCLVADRQQRSPTRGRGARTLRLGQVAAGGAVRWASDRVDGRGSEEERRRRRGDRFVATIDSLVDQLQTMRGAAMKAGQVLSTVEFPGLDADQSAHLQGTPRLAPRRRPRGRLEADAEGDLRRVGGGPRAGARLDRSRAGRRGEHRPGLPRADHEPGSTLRSKSSTRGSPRRWSRTCETSGCLRRSCAG